MIAFLQWLVRGLPSFTILKDGYAYLTRYYVFLKDRVFGNIFIHHFHRSDLDMGLQGLGLLHNHPFEFSVSFVLYGGYIEERLQPDGSITKKVIKPFSFNFLSKKDYHRVDLLDAKNGAWTIFITGSRKNNTWWFFDRISKEYIPYQKITGAIA
jgi:hypothetical protein